jgi:L-rhamnose-H+ transport protein
MDLNLFIAGFLLMLLGGIFQGTFSFPLKYNTRWAWENTWGVGSLMAILILPWPLAFLTIPSLGEVYGSVPPFVLVLAILFGAGWGTGGVFFGKGLDAIGFSVGLALIMGIVAIGGSVIPLAMNQPEAFLKLPGMVLLSGVLVMIAGLYYSAKAGISREHDLMSGTVSGASLKGKVSFKKGLVYCILAGLLSSLVNFGFIYGSPLAEASVLMGARPLHASNAVLALVFTSNFLVNIIFCGYLLFKNKTFGRFSRSGTGKYWITGLAMGVLWSGGIVIYGMGTTMIGELGAYLGFPVLMIVSIVTGNLFGFLTGEWKAASAHSRQLIYTAIAILVFAILIIGLSMNLG